MDSFTSFSPKALTFLRGLRKNNRKDWFEAHRAQYEQELKAPLAALIEEMDVHLATIAPEIVGSPRKSAFRIHRDVRFSKDKSPYKTHVACWFYHGDVGTRMQSEAVHGGAGFYLHVSPGECFCGGGIWMPPRPALHKIRDALVHDLEGWNDIVGDKAFRRRFGELDQEGMLTRVPRGYAADHPAAAWLRYQSFTAGAPLSDDEITSPRLPLLLARHYAAMTPFVRWLTAALGLAPRRSRL
ncbi:MAG: DUF2461 domain-containing protein [Gemmatimonas sp.]